MADTMTQTRKLRLRFVKSDGTKFYQNWSYVKANPARSDVKAFIQQIITDKALFSNQPQEVVSAETVTTSKFVYDLNA